LISIGIIHIFPQGNMLQQSDVFAYLFLRPHSLIEYIKLVVDLGFK